MLKTENFWEVKTLQQMSADEWEALCDGCALCCLLKIEDEESAEVFNTTVSCFLLNIESCQCGDYQHRFARAPMCTRLSLENLPQMNWLPETCAYKRLYAGQPLPGWHPLLTRNKASVHEAGISAKWFAISEEYVHPDQLNEFVIMTDEQ